MNIYEKLSTIQKNLIVPKKHDNEFGGYKYRNCEDILENAKPLCAENKAVLVISDEIYSLNDRSYVKATAKLINLEKIDEVITVTGYAREEETKKGMDGSQITGASSSYARKYALNGLFNIDDTKDSDSTNTHGKEQGNPAPKQPKKDPVEETKKLAMTKHGKDKAIECIKEFLEMNEIKHTKDIKGNEKIKEFMDFVNNWSEEKLPWAHK